MSGRSGSAGPRLTGADRFAIAVGVVVLVLGLVVLLVLPGFAAVIVGSCLLGLAGIAFVALAFLLVGEGEDREYGDGAR